MTNTERHEAILGASGQLVDNDYRSEAECSNGMSRPRQCCGRSELMLKGQTRQRWRQQVNGVDCHKASSAMMAQSKHYGDERSSWHESCIDVC